MIAPLIARTLRCSFTSLVRAGVETGGKNRK